MQVIVWDSHKHSKYITFTDKEAEWNCGRLKQQIFSRTGVDVARCVASAAQHNPAMTDVTRFCM